MTGGGHHRGRVTDRPGGAHWWGGTGRAGGGTHAVRRAGRRGLLLLLALIAVLAAGGIAVAVTATRSDVPTPASAAAPPAAATPTGRSAGARTAPTPDVAVLQSTIDEVLAAAPLRFAADSATPNADTSGSIGRLAAVLAATPGPRVTVEGHTAPTGEQTGGAQQLSEQRAQEIVRRLEAAGVPTGRLTPVGVGPARPLATLDASRRVEVRVG
ncbi:OmpA family protein [Actinomycetospora sp. C-140]